MVSFKFSFGVVGKSKEKGIVNKYVIIVAKCEGIIRYIDGTYKVEYNGKLYSITGESYRTKGKKVVYARRLDEYNHRIKIIRDSENRKTVDTRFYIPFAAGLIAKGKIVKMPFKLVEFLVILLVEKKLILFNHYLVLDLMLILKILTLKILPLILLEKIN